MFRVVTSGSGKENDKVKDHSFLCIYILFALIFTYFRIKRLVQFFKASGGTHSTSSRNQTHLKSSKNYPGSLQGLFSTCFYVMFRSQCPTAMLLYFENLVYYSMIIILTLILLYFYLCSYKTMKQIKFSSHLA